MSKAEKTTQLIIEKTADLFNSKGYAATSLSDVTDITGLTKGSIYGNFKDKDELVVAVFKYNSSRLQKAMSVAIGREKDAYHQLLAVASFYRKIWKEVLLQGGCPMLNAAVEADDHLLFLKQTVKDNFVAWQQRLAHIISAGVKEGLFKADLKVEDYAYTFIMLIEGGILLSRTLNDAYHLNTALDRMLNIIENELLK